MGCKDARYSDQFKAAAVNLVKKEGYTIQATNQQLGDSRYNLN